MKTFIVRNNYEKNEKDSKRNFTKGTYFFSDLILYLNVN